MILASVMRGTGGGASGQTGLARSIVLIALILTIAIGTTVALAQPLM